MARGLFITFEGGEGAGKTTQIKRLAAALPGCVLTREPGGTDDAEALRNVFFQNRGQDWPPQAQLLLMFAARTLHTKNLIEPALGEGKTVICDRYTDSTRVYQGVAEGLSPDDIERIKHFAIGDFEPDLTFILDIDPEEGLRRTMVRAGAETAFEAKDIAFHQKLRAGFAEIAAKNPGRCVIIDAARDADVVAAEILQKVRDVR